MSYLMIENEGECPVEGYTILGLSSSRGKDSAIGQFGSGNKHAVLCLMRHGIYPVIYSGRNKITYSVASARMGDTQYNKVLFQLNNAKQQELGFCLEFGEMDWDNISMALREFISNAIDADADGWTWEIVETPRAKSGFTRVFIPTSADVLRYVADMKTQFLHLTGKQNLAMLLKDTESTAKIYRKGVLVRSLSCYEKPSLYDYNFGNELRIDEARNLNDYECLHPAAWLLTQNDHAIRKVLLSFQNKERYWEHKFSSYSLTLHPTAKERLKSAFEGLFGEKSVACATGIEADMAQRKGYIAIVVESRGWFDALNAAGVTTSNTVLSNAEKKGKEIKTADDKLAEKAKMVWSWLQDVNMTRGKTMPPVLQYTEPMDSETVLGGYYQDGKVYINTYCKDDAKVLIEEYAHYITGATDNSRDFQDYAFLLATEMARLIYE